MKKQYRHDQLSERECHHPGCKTKIKLNVLLRNPNAMSCYLHGLLERGKTHIRKGRFTTSIKLLISRKNRKESQAVPAK